MLQHADSLMQCLDASQRPPLLCAWRCCANGAVEGRVYGDPRFRDGTRVRTSPAALLAPPLLVTRNSVYRLAAASP